MDELRNAIISLRNGEFILIHDSKSREDEVDLVKAAQFIKPNDIAIMRKEAGGLICLAISNDIARKLDLPYMHDMFRQINNPTISKMIEESTPYGDRPSFSITINHIDTYTGISDIDRSLTVTNMYKICSDIDNKGKKEFTKNFRTPGHIPVLISAKNLLKERSGHTELSIKLMSIADLTPVVVICEMLDSETHMPLKMDKAGEYSSKYGIPLVEAMDIQQNSEII